MASRPSIKLKFQNSSLSDAENKTVEKVGMLALASDFLKSKKVGKADRVAKISKAYLPIYLGKTRTGGYIGINPNATNQIKIPLTRLVDLPSFKEFLKDESNLEINRIYKKIMSFSVEEAYLTGGIYKSDAELLKSLLSLPRGEDSAAKVIPPIKPVSEIKTELASINDLIYDDKTVKAETKNLLDAAEKALKDNLDNYNKDLKEFQTKWKTDLKTLETEEKKKLAEREKKLQADKKGIRKKAEADKKKKLDLLLKGITKNMKKDAQEILNQIEKFQGELANLSATPYEDLIKKIQYIEDEGSSFMAAVGLARDNVYRTKSEEGDIDHFALLATEDLENSYEKDIAEIKAIREKEESKSESEILGMTSKRDDAQTKYDSFLSQRAKWEQEIRKGVLTDDTLMIPADYLDLQNSPPLVDLLIPVYLFQYKNNKGKIVNVIIPPVKLPDNLSKVKDKNVIRGKNKIIQYIPIHPDVEKLTSWVEKMFEENIDLRQSIDGLPSMITDHASNYQLLTSGKTIFTGSLMMKDKDYQKLLAAVSEAGLLV